MKAMAADVAPSERVGGVQERMSRLEPERKQVRFADPTIKHVPLEFPRRLHRMQIEMCRVHDLMQVKRTLDQKC